MKAVLAACLLLACSAPAASASQPLTRQRPGPVTIRGVAIHVRAGGFTLRTLARGSYTVVITADTSVTVKGRHTVLREGDHVGVRGFLHARGIRAILVRIYPVKPKPYTIKGTVASLGTRRLDVRLGGSVVHVIVNAHTVVRIGSELGSLGRMRVGQRVSVRVAPTSHGLVALHIHVYHQRSSGRHVDIVGTLAAVSAGRIVVRFSSQSYTVRLTQQTRIYLGNRRATLSALQVSESVRVYACCAGRPLAATSIHIRKTKPRRATVLLKGVVVDLSNERLLLRTGKNTISIGLSSSTAFEVGSQRVGRYGVRVGDHVSVRAQRVGAAIVATRIHVYAAYRRIHTLIGVVTGVVANQVMVLARSRRYTVVAGPDIPVSIGGNRSSLNAIRSGDHIRARGHLDGTTLTATRISVTRPVPALHALHGTVTTVSRASLTLLDAARKRWYVRISSRTRLLVRGKPGSRAALFVGVHATVRGTESGSTITASSVDLSVADRKTSGRIRSLRGPTLTVSSATGRRTRIDVAPGATILDRGRHIALSGLSPGAYIRARGYAEPPGRVRATRLTVLHPSLDITVTILSTGPDPRVRTSAGETYRLVMGSSTVLTAGHAQWDLSLDDIPEGGRGHVRGTMRSDGALGVQELDVHLASMTLRGTIAAGGNGTLTVVADGKETTVRLGARTTVYQGSHAIHAGDLVVGDDVTVWGYAGAAGALLARKLDVHRPLVGLDGTVLAVAPQGFTVQSGADTLRVIVQPTTQISVPIAAGVSIHVTGYRRGDGAVLATRVRAGKKQRLARYTSNARLRLITHHGANQCAACGTIGRRPATSAIWLSASTRLGFSAVIHRWSCTAAETRRSRSASATSWAKRRISSTSREAAGIWQRSKRKASRLSA